MTFLERCIFGNARLEDIDDEVDLWHTGVSPLELHEFLGMTWEEYCRWVQHPDVLSNILLLKQVNAWPLSLLPGSFFGGRFVAETICPDDIPVVKVLDNGEEVWVPGAKREQAAQQRP
jgi:hypothetical protein